MKKVYVSASVAARRYCTGPQIEGQILNVADDTVALRLFGEERTPASASTDEPDLVPLIATPTGNEYRGLPWWEIRLA
jgi:hypothetical protein